MLAFCRCSHGFNRHREMTGPCTAYGCSCQAPETIDKKPEPRPIDRASVLEDLRALRTWLSGIRAYAGMQVVENAIKVIES